MACILNRIRNCHPYHLPNTLALALALALPLTITLCSSVGGVEILGVRDLTTGLDTDAADGRATLPLSASSNMITFRLANGATATLRGSGTEPKIKW